MAQPCRSLYLTLWEPSFSLQGIVLLAVAGTLAQVSRILAIVLAGVLCYLLWRT